VTPDGRRDLIRPKGEGLAAHLIASTARLQAGGGTATGFFVTDQLLLTCAHLIPKIAEVGQRVTITAADFEDVGTVRNVFGADGYPDLLCVETSGDRRSDAWVYLGPGATYGDEVYAYGYPHKRTGGDSFYGRIEGVSDVGTGEELLKFKETSVSEGASGSPLLNHRTGAVCGMIRTASYRNDGGRALPAEVILELLPEVREWQAENAADNREWLRELSEGQLVAGAWDPQLVHVARPAHDPFERYCRGLIDLADQYLSQGLLPGAEPIEVTSKASPEVLRRQVPQALAEWKPPIFSVNVNSSGFGRSTEQRFTTLHDALELYRWRMLLLGEPGAGKTVCLLDLGQAAARRRLRDRTAPIPLYVPIRLWRHDIDRDLASWIGRVADIDPRDVADAIAAGQVILLLDGLDELERLTPKATALTDEKQDPPTSLLNELSKLDETPIILACRRTDYETIAETVTFRLPFLGAATLERLSPAQIEEYVRSLPVLHDALTIDEGLLGLAANPLLLALLAKTVLLDPTRFADLGGPDSSADAARQVFRGYVETRFKWETERPSSAKACTIEEFYEALGTGLVKSAMVDDPSGDWVIDRGALAGVAGDKADAILQLAVNMDLLTPSGYLVLSRIRFSFRHALLRDHFAYPAALRLLAGDERKDQFSAVLALGRLGSVPGAMERLVELAQSEEVAGETRAMALIAIGAQRDQDAYPVLRAAARSENPGLALGAAMGWAKHDGVLAVNELMQVIHEYGEDDHRAFMALLQVAVLTANNSEAQRGYLTILRERPSWASRLATLVRLTEPDDRAEASVAYRDLLPKASGSFHRAALLTGIAAVDQEESLDVLLRWVASRDEQVQSATQRALRKLGQQIVPALLERLETADDETYVRIIQTLGLVGGSAAIDVLESVASTHADEMAQMTALVALSAADEQDRIIPFLDSDNLTIRMLAIALVAADPVKGFGHVLDRVVSADEFDIGAAKSALYLVFVNIGFDRERLTALFSAVEKAPSKAAAELIDLSAMIGDLRAWPVLDRLAESTSDEIKEMAVAARSKILADYSHRLKVHRLSGTISSDELAAAAAELKRFSPFPLVETADSMQTALSTKDKDLGVAAFATILSAGRSQLAEMVDHLATSETQRPDPVIAGGIAAILMGGGASARHLVELLERQPIAVREFVSQLIHARSGADLTSTTTAFQRELSARSGYSVRSGSAQSTPRTGRRRSIVIGMGLKDGEPTMTERVVTELLEPGHSRTAQIFALRWLATRKSTVARAALIRRLRTPDDISHLAALGLGLTGRSAEAEMLVKYLRRADPKGRACALWALAAVRRPSLHQLWQALTPAEAPAVASPKSSPKPRRSGRPRPRR
jgi:hypothetical protein